MRAFLPCRRAFKVNVNGYFVMPCRRAFRVNVFKVNVFKVNVFKVNVFKVNVFKVNVFKVNGHFVQAKACPSRGGMRPAPAPRLSGKHNRPPQAGTFVGSHFFMDRSRFAPAQRSLVPPSMAGHPKMFTSSAVVMPPQGQPPSQNPGQNPNI
ncbi:hypothetical protein [Duffyella gerundensis]|uniref:hypothetical protein n=1 Tax=Duffyella gerundensis TaxID=1619313 RepID=UPI0012FF3230|nr:hypothetical protein [Duffyella gerundensis]